MLSYLQEKLLHQKTLAALIYKCPKRPGRGFAQPGRIEGTTKDGRPVTEVMAAGRRKAARNRSRTAATIRAELLAEVSAILAANPDASLRQIASALEVKGIKTPRGKAQWNPTAVSRLLAE